jgi:hypothetical protein
MLGGELDRRGRQTSLSEGFVVEARLSYGEGVPLAGDDSLVDVDDIEVFILPAHLVSLS